MQNLRFGEEGFKGLEAGVSPDNIPPGYLAVLDDCFLDGIGGAYGADIKTRPGKRGLWSSLSESLWPGALSYRKSNGEQWVYMVAGGGEDVAGKVYGTLKNSNTRTHISAIGSFKETQTQFCRFGKWVFVSGNVDGGLRRFDPNSPASPYTCNGVATPTYRPIASSTNRIIYDAQSPTPEAVFSDATEWAVDTISSGGFTVTDSSFASGSTSDVSAGSDLSANAWEVLSAAVRCVSGASVDAEFPTLDYAELDDPGSSVITDSAAILTNKTKSNTNGVGAVRYASHFRFDCRMRTNYITDSVRVTLHGCDNSGNTIGLTTVEIPALGAGVVSNRTVYLSLAGVLDDTLPVKLKIQLTAGDGTRGGNSGPFISNVALAAIEPTVTFTDSGDYIDVSALYSAAGYTQPSDTILLGQTHLAYDLNSTVTTLDSMARFAIPIKRYVDFPIPRVQLALRETSGDSSPAYTDDLVFVTDADGEEYLVGDFSVLTDSDISDVTHIDLVFFADIAIPAGSVNTGQALFGIGALIEAGGLSVGDVPYEYRFCEKQSSTGIISGGGLVSEVITPLDWKASARLSLAHVSTLTADSTADRLVLYRRGGLLGDSFFRKIAEFDPDSAGSGDYWTWDESAKVFVDRTPDTALQSAETGSTVSDVDFYFSDHVGAPANIRAICVREGRLYAIVGTDELWISQLTTVENAFGLYWNRVQDPSSRNQATQGFYTRLSGNDGASTYGDSAKRLIVFRDYVIAWFTSARYVIGGGDALDFYVRRWEGDEGRGLMAPFAITVYDGLIWYLSQDGLRAFDLVNDWRVSTRLDRLISPKAVFSGSALNAAAYRRAIVLGHGGRILLTAPLPGESAIGTMYLCDLRAGRPTDGGGSWYRWNLGEISGGVVLSGDGDTDDLFLTEGKAGVSHGQIYSIGSAWGDRLFPTDNSTAVTMSARTRSFRDEGAELRAERLFLTTDCDQARSITWVVSGGDAGSTVTKGYGCAAGVNDIPRLKIPSNVKGRDLWVQLFCPVVETPMTFRRVALEAQPGRAL